MRVFGQSGPLFDCQVGPFLIDKIPPDIAEHLRKRRTSVEPLFDLVAKVLGTVTRQKQLPIQRLETLS